MCTVRDTVRSALYALLCGRFAAILVKGCYSDPHLGTQDKEEQRAGVICPERVLSWGLHSIVSPLLWPRCGCPGGREASQHDSLHPLRRTSQLRNIAGMRAGSYNPRSHTCPDLAWRWGTGAHGCSRVHADEAILATRFPTAPVASIQAGTVPLTTGISSKPELQGHCGRSWVVLLGVKQNRCTHDRDPAGPRQAGLRAGGLGRALSSGRSSSRSPGQKQAAPPRRKRS